MGNRLLQLNSWINEGKYSYYIGKLKDGIIKIIKWNTKMWMPIK